MQAGSPVTVSGTATDTGGGVVGGVEVSTDGGTTWHPATGRGAWTYTLDADRAVGTATIMARASDDSAESRCSGYGLRHRAQPGPVRAASGVPAATPDDPPRTPTPAPTSSALKFRSDVAGQVTALRFYKGAATPAPTSATSGPPPARSSRASPSPVKRPAVGSRRRCRQPGHTVRGDDLRCLLLRAEWPLRRGRRLSSQHRGIDAPPLHALKDGTDGPNGVYRPGSGGGFPTQAFQSANYWVDVVFAPSNSAPDTTPPTVTARTPAAGATGVATGTTVTATFSEPVQAAAQRSQ